MNKYKIIGKSSIFCPICGTKQVYFLEAPGFTHYCTNCGENYTYKGIQEITYK